MTVEEVLKVLEQQRDQLDPESAETELRSQAAAIATAASVLDNRMTALRTLPLTIRAIDAKIAAEQHTLDVLKQAHETLSAEFDALPPKIRDSKTLGVMLNIRTSLHLIDGRPVPDMFGFSLNTLRIGQLLKAAGFPETAPIENQVHGELAWPGSRPDVERRIARLRLERSEAQHRIEEALATDADRATKLGEIQAKNAAGQLKTRGDGSQFRKFPDGRIEEVEASA